MAKPRMRSRIPMFLLAIALSLSLLTLWTSPSVEEERQQKEMMQHQTKYRLIHGANDHRSTGVLLGDRRLSASTRMLQPLSIVGGNLRDGREAGGMMLMNHGSFIPASEPESHLSVPSLPVPPDNVEFEQKAHLSLRNSKLAKRQVDDHAQAVGHTTDPLASSTSSYHLTKQSLGRMKLVMPKDTSSVAVSPLRGSTANNSAQEGSPRPGISLSVACMAVLVLGSVFVKRRLRTRYNVRNRESMPLLHDGDDDSSYSILYTSTTSDAGYGSIVSSSWTDDFDRFDL